MPAHRGSAYQLITDHAGVRFVDLYRTHAAAPVPCISSFLGDVDEYAGILVSAVAAHASSRFPPRADHVVTAVRALAHTHRIVLRSHPTRCTTRPPPRALSVRRHEHDNAFRFEAVMDGAMHPECLWTKPCGARPTTEPICGTVVTSGDDTFQTLSDPSDESADSDGVGGWRVELEIRALDEDDLFELCGCVFPLRVAMEPHLWRVGGAQVCPLTIVDMPGCHVVLAMTDAVADSRSVRGFCDVLLYVRGVMAVRETVATRHSSLIGAIALDVDADTASDSDAVVAAAGVVQLDDASASRMVATLLAGDELSAVVAQSRGVLGRIVDAFALGPSSELLSARMTEARVVGCQDEDDIAIVAQHGLLPRRLRTAVARLCVHRELLYTLDAPIDPPLQAACDAVANMCGRCPFSVVRVADAMTLHRSLRLSNAVGDADVRECGPHDDGSLVALVGNRVLVCTGSVSIADVMAFAPRMAAAPPLNATSRARVFSARAPYPMAHGLTTDASRTPSN